MANKNAFELRADLLKQSQEHLESQWASTRDFITMTTQNLVEQNKVTLEEIQKLVPVYPTSDAIIEQAKKFYSFVLDTSK